METVNMNFLGSLKRSNWKRVSSLLACAVALVMMAGCTAQRRTVVGRAPNLGEKVLTFENEYGEIKQPDISIFLWPADLSGDALREAILRVKLASNRIDELKIDGNRKGRQVQTLSAEFSADQCIEKYAALPEGTDPLDVDEVTEWKVAANDADKASIEKCVQNQIQRQSLKSELGAAAQEASGLIDVINITIDPTYPKTVNWKPVLKSKDSKIVIKDASTVELTIRGFLDSKNDFSSLPGKSKVAGVVDDKVAIQDLSYNFERKQLKFVLPFVPETKVAADGSTTTVYARYEMTLERTNFDGQPRFSGDVKYSVNGQTRNGSIKIDGTLVPVN